MPLYKQILLLKTNFNWREKMRRPFIAGNWKMNMDKAGAVALAVPVADGA